MPCFDKVEGVIKPLWFGLRSLCVVILISIGATHKPWLHKHTYIHTSSGLRTIDRFIWFHGESEPGTGIWNYYIENSQSFCWWSCLLTLRLFHNQLIVPYSCFNWRTPLDQNIRKTLILQATFVFSDRKCWSSTLCMFSVNHKKQHTVVKCIWAFGRCVACRNALVLSLFRPPNTDTSILKRD